MFTPAPTLEHLIKVTAASAERVAQVTGGTAASATLSSVCSGQDIWIPILLQPACANKTTPA